VSVNGNETHPCADCGRHCVVMLVGVVGPEKKRTSIELCWRCREERASEHTERRGT
jgi:hypothetical protein